MKVRMNKKFIRGLLLLHQNIDGDGGFGQSITTLPSTLFLEEIGAIGSLLEEDKTISGKEYLIDH